MMEERLNQHLHTMSRWFANRIAKKKPSVMDNGQRYAKDVLAEETFQTWFDLIPNNDAPFIMEAVTGCCQMLVDTSSDLAVLT